MVNPLPLELILKIVKLTDSDDLDIWLFVSLATFREAEAEIRRRQGHLAQLWDETGKRFAELCEQVERCVQRRAGDAADHAELLRRAEAETDGLADLYDEMRYLLPRCRRDGAIFVPMPTGLAVIRQMYQTLVFHNWLAASGQSVVNVEGRLITTQDSFHYIHRDGYALTRFFEGAKSQRAALRRHLKLEGARHVRSSNSIIQLSNVVVRRQPVIDHLFGPRYYNPASGW